MANTTHAGHGGKGSPNRPMDPGAVGNGTTEHGEMLSVNSLLVASTKWTDTTDRSGSTINNNLYNIVNNVNRVARASDTNVSNHMNAFNGKATGVEVWYYLGDSKGYQLASKLSSAISSALGLQNRGAKATTDLYVVRETVGTTVLIEWCFIDNPTDMKQYRANKDKAINVVLNVLGYKGASTVSKPQEKITQGRSNATGGLWYRSHLSNIGWLGFVGTEETSGTTGKSIPIEAIDVRWDNQTDKISASFQDIKGKWYEWTYGVTGTTGKGLPLVKVRFDTGVDIRKTGRTLQYRVHSADVGWSDWVNQGETVGTSGKRIEAIQMRMLKNGKVEKG